MRTMLRTAALAASLSLSVAAQAKSHLDKAEIKSFGATSLTVIYMDPAQPLAGYLDPANTSTMPSLVGMAASAAVNLHRLNVFSARLQPYQTQLGMLGIQDALYDAVHGALLQVPWLQRAVWQRAQTPASGPSVRKAVHAARTRVVIIVSPCLLMSVDGKKLTLRSSFDVEIANPAGSYDVEHYDLSELDATWDVGVDGMPPVPQLPGPGTDVVDARLATYFAGEAKGFRLMFAALQPEAARQAYYYFTGEALSPPAVTAAAPAAATH